MALVEEYEKNGNMKSQLDLPTINNLLKYNPPGKKTFITKIVNAFYTDTSARFELAKTQQAAGNFAALAISLHAIQGSCRNVGAKDLAKCLQSMEIEGSRGNPCTSERLLEVEATFKQIYEELKTYLD
jgi:HPt (histidine-containing phosphotransfer) domain-containing protein